MSTRKEKEFKDFLVKARKKRSQQLSEAPVWVIQRAGKRYFNRHQQRNWRETHLARDYHNKKRKRKKHKKE
jgi:ribosomal protein L39E